MNEEAIRKYFLESKLGDLRRISHRVGESTIILHAPSSTVFKFAPKYLMDNEWHWLRAMQQSGYVPSPVLRKGIETIAMPYIKSDPITDPDEFMRHLPLVLSALLDAECRHGDLTEYSVLVRNNKPVIIDFGESREWYSSLPDKRPEGDRFWLGKTMEKLVHDSKKK